MGLEGRVAIIGGGFAGLSSAFRFVEKGVKVVHIYDRHSAGKAPASSAAGGLMHPFSPKGLFLWKGLESYFSAKNLFEKVENISSISSSSSSFIRSDISLIRPILKESDQMLWSQSYLSMNQWMEVVSEEQLGRIYGHDREGRVTAAFRLHPAMIIEPSKYLECLWDCIQKKSDQCEWIEKQVEDLSLLAQEYDHVIVCAGEGTPLLLTQGDNPCQLNVRHVAGSNLIFKNRGKSLSIALLSGEYVVPRAGQQPQEEFIIAGATHDHLHENEIDIPEYSVDSLSSSLLPRLIKIYPSLKNMEIVGISSGIRLVTQRSNRGRLPILGKHPIFANVWIFSGLGARGLLYHSLLSEYLIEAIHEGNNDQSIPSELSIHAHSKR